VQPPKFDENVEVLDAPVAVIDDSGERGGARSPPFGALTRSTTTPSDESSRIEKTCAH
jgi:hypothetical protein